VGAPLREGFQPVGEVEADDRSRIAFGRAGVAKHARYMVAVNDDGQVLLTPLASIPARELVVWQNDELRAAVTQGLADSAAGRVTSLGSFAAFADEPDDEA
jgi:hypothetical protein